MRQQRRLRNQAMDATHERQVGVLERRLKDLADVIHHRAGETAAHELDGMVLGAERATDDGPLHTVHCTTSVLLAGRPGRVRLIIELEQ